MTVTLSPDTEAKVVARAQREGQDVDHFLDTIIQDALAEDPDELTEEEIDSIRNGVRKRLDAATNGQVRPLNDYAAEVLQKRMSRKA